MFSAAFASLDSPHRAESRRRALAFATRRGSWLLLGAMLAASAWLRIALIFARGQYPLYHDEEFITQPAWHMVRDGTLEPGSTVTARFPSV
jgi:hypothetical protein